MKSDGHLDYAVFQLSPRRSHCELFVSSNGNTEKLASGLVKPFVAHLKVVEEQVASDAQSVKLEVGRQKSSKTWFTKGTLERFVRFVSTPEVLELVNTFDAEMSQLEAAQKIYAEDRGNQLSGGGTSGVTTSADMTKKELLRAIDVRLVTVQQDLTTACARAASAGFNGDTVSELQMFAEFFGGHRLNEACSKYISLCERRGDLITPCGAQDGAVRSSYGSDMSIDEDPSPQPTGTDAAQTQHQGDRSTFQQPTPSTSFSVQHTFSCKSSIERDDSNKQNDEVVEKETKKGESSSADQTESTRMSHHVRRLSVQDRISLFENKQKETSGSAGKPAVRKSVELRRLSSDVSSAPASVEKAVLRRWSGASDMSIDLSAEKKDNESPLCTPSSVSGLQSKSEEKKALNLNDTLASSVKPESRIIPGMALGRVVDSGLKDNSSFSKSNDGSESSMSNPNLSTTEFDGPKDQTHGKSQSRSFIVRAEDQENSEEKFRSFPDSKHVLIGFRDQGKLKGGSLSGKVLGDVKGKVASDTQFTEVKDQGALQTQIRTFEIIGGGQVEISDWKEHYELRDQLVTQSRSKSPQKIVGDSGQFEGLAGSRIREAFAAHYKGTERSLSSMSSKRSAGYTDEAGKKELVSSEKICGSSVSKVEDSGLQKMKFQRLVSAPEQINKSLLWKDESNSVYGSRTSFSGKLMMEGQDGFDSFLTPTSEQVQRLRLANGNQELNDKLKIKANELERLFAELQLPGDQSSSACRVRSADVPGESTASSSYTKPIGDTTPRLSDNYLSIEPIGSSNNTIKFSAAPLMTTVENQKYGDAELNFSEGARGKLYDMYMLKRDAKLREEWGSKKAEKEAKLKTMRDRFEQSTAEMKAKFSGSADRQNSVSGARQRAERLRSFNTRSSMKGEQKRIDFEDSEGDKDATEFQEQEHLRGDSTWNEASFGHGVSRSAPGKMLPTKSLSTSMTHASAAPTPRSAVKASILNSGKGRMQSENPLVQSVHNFFDTRRENTQLSSAASKTTRLQLRNYARDKSTSEETPIVKERSRRSQSLRKNSANLSELRDVSPLDSEDAVLTPLELDEEVVKNDETRPFLKKGSRADFVAPSRITKNISMTPEPQNNEEDNKDLAFEPEDMGNTVKGEEEEEFESMGPKGHKDLDNGKPRLSLGSEKLVNSGCENGDTMRSFSQVDQALGAELPAIVQDWTAESPLSWSTPIQHPFSYPREMSDVDASIDFPVGSPASWNSNCLRQIETDTARMRKKWGMAQKPMWVAHPSNNISRKDMTKGFKRLLKFGRKNRGSENLVDWISATTSEGDDDTEDGRDPSNRSSEDLRKSRMGFSQGQPSDESFTESEFFNKQVQSSHSSISAPAAYLKLREDHISVSSIKAPRSFFSLSTFRSKGSESRPKQHS
ncbi:uncharacterized protein LOC111405076 isoform X3 [Olea europaea var. sylvestris]|uniref:uncharacterized protein LOC111405076 isoform X3 n=1 Tax=Olea europaea var. sylvestris TaxID=158386 RepID=UPI000C1D4D85|nr:uncharacterized protein LOC111405076 isoform X3 [Olea europaea var. sylvestris]